MIGLWTNGPQWKNRWNSDVVLSSGTTAAEAEDADGEGENGEGIPDGDVTDRTDDPAGERRAD